MSDTALWPTLAAGRRLPRPEPCKRGGLFAVSQGMQQRERRAVLRALLPMALMAAIVLGAAAVIDPRALYVGAAGVLLAFGIFRLVRPRARPPLGEDARQRARTRLWSFLMTTALASG